MQSSSFVATDVAPHLFWITSRAAGIAALALASLTVSVGLLAHTGLLSRFSKANLRVVHESLSLSTLALIALHGAALLGDSFMHPSLLDIAVPFLSGYRTLWTSLGIVAGWGLAVLGLSYYARRLIGQGRWRQLHRLSALAWLLGLIHSLGEGTDAGQLWFLMLLAIVALPALGLLAWRSFGARHPATRATASRRAAPTS